VFCRLRRWSHVSTGRRRVVVEDKEKEKEREKKGRGG
jgi:hypothetical protein